MKKVHLVSSADLYSQFVDGIATTRIINLKGSTLCGRFVLYDVLWTQFHKLTTCKYCLKELNDPRSFEEKINEWFSKQKKASK